jgi:hypothetical protein
MVSRVAAGVQGGVAADTRPNDGKQPGATCLATPSALRMIATDDVLRN